MEVDDGDGTVSRRSLEAYLPWREVHPAKVTKPLMVPNVNHIDILKDEKVLRYVLQVATN